MKITHKDSTHGDIEVCLWTSLYSMEDVVVERLMFASVNDKSYSLARHTGKGWRKIHEGK
jgi:hypothetical protein